jgi:hypothetical protein
MDFLLLNSKSEACDDPPAEQDSRTSNSPIDLKHLMIENKDLVMFICSRTG